jgi:hypothetical protein
MPMLGELPPLGRERGCLSGLHYRINIRYDTGSPPLLAFTLLQHSKSNCGARNRRSAFHVMDAD